jgi:hypothetical protein
MIKKKAFFFVLIFCGLVLEVYSQTGNIMASNQFDMSGFPLWAKDLRRAEIVAFGSFPLMYFFSNFGFDTYRWGNHGNDMRYAPWPFNSAGTIEKTTNEKIITLGIAAGGAVLISLIDYGIMRYKRSRLEREQGNLPDGSPIIIRRPLYDEETDSAAEGFADTLSETK